MQPNGFRDRIYPYVLAAQRTSAVGIIFVGATLKTELSPQFNSLIIDYAGPLLEKSQGNAWWLLPFFLVIGTCSSIFSSVSGSPWVWKSIDKLVRDFADDIFADFEQDYDHAHRVTLFKKCNWWVRFWHWRPRRGPSAGWLVPVVRSCNTTRKTNTIFVAPDTTKDIEGVVGLTWVTRGPVHIKDLPDLETASTDRNIRIYAEKARVSEEWVRNRIKEKKNLARSFCGIKVERNGQAWGVLIIDSAAQELPVDDKVLPEFKRLAEILGKFLEGA